MQSGLRLPIHDYVDVSRDRVVSQSNVMPARGGRERSRTPFRTDAHPLTSVHMKNTVVNGLLGARIHGEMCIVEMCWIAIRESNQQGCPLRLHVGVQCYAAIVRQIGERE